MPAILSLLWFCVLGLYLYVAELIEWLTSPSPYVPRGSSADLGDETEESKQSWPNRGKLAIVTGGNGGIGLETSRSLLLDGVNVVIACRSQTSGKAAVDLLSADAAKTGATVSSLPLDLSSMKSVMEFCRLFRQKYDSCDILVCNAGIMAVPFSRTADGFESQMATNHLGHSLLIQELLPLLKKKATSENPSRVVLVTSSTHHHCRAIEFSSWNPSETDLKKAVQKYSAGAQYEQSKLANVLTAFALQRQHAPTVQFYAVHPGIVATNISRGLPLGLPLLVDFMGRLLFKTPAQGAETQVKCALDPEVRHQGGAYWANSQKARASALALDQKLQDECWLRTLDMVASFRS